MELTIPKILYIAVWDTYQGQEARCKGCDIYKWTDKPHKPDCPYGEILKRVNSHEPGGIVPELVTALEKLSKLGNEPHLGNSDGNKIAQQALVKYKASGAAKQGPNGQDAQPLSKEKPE